MTGELKNFKKSAAKRLQHHLNGSDKFERRSVKSELVVGVCFVCKCEGATKVLPAAPPDYKVLSYHPNCLATFGV
jgi:hypothetical protein